MLRVYGERDNLIKVEGDSSLGREDLSAYDERMVLRVGTADAGIVIGAEYVSSWHPDGCWVFAVAPIAEDVPCPWPVVTRIGPNATSPHSSVVEVDCPPGTPVEVERYPVRGQGRSVSDQREPRVGDVWVHHRDGATISQALHVEDVHVLFGGDEYGRMYMDAATWARELAAGRLLLLSPAPETDGGGE